MGEILPDGSIQGYFGRCKICRKEIEVNFQGDERGSHDCIKHFQCRIIMFQQRLSTAESERDRLKAENGEIDSMYQDRLLDMEYEVNKAVSEHSRIKDENERLRNELKLCNRSRKWWRSLAYEANAEKISCRAATIKQNEQAKAALREVDGGKETY